MQQTLFINYLLEEAYEAGRNIPISMQLNGENLFIGPEFYKLYQFVR